MNDRNTTILVQDEDTQVVAWFNKNFICFSAEGNSVYFKKEKIQELIKFLSEIPTDGQNI